MTVYTIRYNSDVSKELKPFFAVDDLWNARPHDALRATVAATLVCNATMTSTDAKNIDRATFLQILFSALPRAWQLGSIIGFSRAYLRALSEKGNSRELLQITNYIFKSLSLETKDMDALVVDRALRISRELHYWANIELHAIRSKDQTYYSVPQALDATIDHYFDNDSSFINSSNDVVFTFLTSKYLDNFRIWLDLYRRHDILGRHLLVVAIGDGLSEPINRLLHALGMNCATVMLFKPPTKLSAGGNGTNLNFLWYVKIHMAARLVQRDIRVIYSDLDAYWIKDYFDVRKRVSLETHADIVVSITHDMPRSAVLDWTFTPCAGFFSVEPTSAGKSFMSEWLRMTEVMFDDQIALAQLLQRYNIDWAHSDVCDLTAISQMTTPNGVGVVVAALSSEIARRAGHADPETIGNATIWHPRWVLAPHQHSKLINSLPIADPL